VKCESSSNRSLDVIREADVGQQKRVSASRQCPRLRSNLTRRQQDEGLVTNLGGTAECLSAFRPIVDGRFLLIRSRSLPWHRMPGQVCEASLWDQTSESPTSGDVESGRY